MRSGHGGTDFFGGPAVREPSKSAYYPERVCTRSAAKASHFVPIDDQLQERAKKLSDAGLTPLDALHVASAEAAQADYFCTCDDKLAKHVKRLCWANLKAVSPIELLKEIEI